MSIAAPASTDATPSSTPSSTPQPTSTIADNYDANGHQEVEAGVFDFDKPEGESGDDGKPFVESIDGDALDDVTPDNGEPAKPAPAKPADPAKPAEPVLLAGKYKTEQELKNAFIELGGDPAKFEDIKMLEQAYEVRQTEFSRSKAQIKANTPPPPAPKSVQDLLKEQFGNVDPNKFEGPQQMWQAMMDGLGNVLTQVQEQTKQQVQPLDPQTIDRNIHNINSLNDLKVKVPRLAKDDNLKRSFGHYILRARDEGKMPVTKDGYEDLSAAFRNMIQDQQAVVEEANKAFTVANDGKTLSTATAGDGAPTNPAGARKSGAESLIDDLLSAKAENDRKYGNM